MPATAKIASTDIVSEVAKMAPKTTTESTADPATASYMRDIGKIPLLNHREEQDCGLLIERRKYFEEIHRKARFPKEPYIALGILKRIERQKTLVVALTQTASMSKDPPISALTTNLKFRNMVDIKQKETTIKKIKKRTRTGSNLRNDEELVRRMTQVSRDTFCLTSTIISAVGDCTVSELTEAIKDPDLIIRLRGSKEKLRKEFERFDYHARGAQDKLTESNMRLVVSIANDFTNNNIPLLDLAQEGGIGLIDASQRYNHRLGWKFSTYATWWIRHRITKVLAKQGRAIRIPENKHKLAREIYFTRNNLAQEFGREPNDAETAAQMNIDLELLHHIDSIDQNPDSLDELIFEDNTTTRAERVAANTPGPEEVAINNMLKPDLRKALTCLSEDERTVINMRYGLDDDVKCTMSEIAKTLRTDREQIREMEKNAISKLQNNTQVTEMLREYL